MPPADLLGSHSEVEFCVGYRGEVGTFYGDIGYGYDTYPGFSRRTRVKFWQAVAPASTKPSASPPIMLL